MFGCNFNSGLALLDGLELSLVGHDYVTNFVGHFILNLDLCHDLSLRVTSRMLGDF